MRAMSVRLRVIVGRVSLTAFEMLSAVPARERSICGLCASDFDRLAHGRERQLEVDGRSCAERDVDVVLLLLLEPAHRGADRVRADAHVQDAEAAVGAGDGLVARARVGVCTAVTVAPGRTPPCASVTRAGDVAGRHGLRRRGSRRTPWRNRARLAGSRRPWSAISSVFSTCMVVNRKQRAGNDGAKV